MAPKTTFEMLSLVFRHTFTGQMSIAFRNTAVRMTQSCLYIIETAAIIYDQSRVGVANIMGFLPIFWA